MSLPGVGIITMTDLALGLLLAAALAYFLSSLYPHPHRRGLITAAALAVISLFGFAAERIPPLQLPLHAVVIADCAVVENPRFTDQLTALEVEGPFLRDIHLFILPNWDGTLCSKSPPSGTVRNVEYASTAWSRTQALKAATSYLDSNRERSWLSWPRRWAEHPRIVIAHAPGSALGPISSSESVTPTHRLLDGRAAQLYQYSYGKAAVHHSLLTVTPPILTQEPATRGVTLEIEDDRLHHAVKAKTTIVIRYVQPAPGGVLAIDSSNDYLNNCVVKESSVNKPEVDLTALKAASVQRNRQSSDLVVISTGSTGKMTRLVLYYRLIVPASHCSNASVWVAVSVNVVITLGTGGKLLVKRTEMLPVVNTSGVTLVTPGSDATAKQKHAAAPGWDSDSNPEGYGVNGGPSIEDLLSLFFEAVDPDMCNPGCTPLPPSILQETEACWFRGAGDLSRRRDVFERCLEHTHRLVLIGPSHQEITAVGWDLVDEYVKNGKLNVLVSAPTYSYTDEMPSWAPAVLSQAEIRGEPRVHLVLSLRDSLRIRGASGSALQQQRHLINAIASLGLVGPSTDNSDLLSSGTAIQCKPGEMFPNDGGLAWFADLSTGVPRQAPEIGEFPSSGGAVGTIRPRESPYPTHRLKGVLKVETPRTPAPNPAQRRKPGAYAYNMICHSPSVRLVGMIDELYRRGLIDAKSAHVPRTVVAIMAENSLQVSLMGAMSYESTTGSNCLGFPLSEHSVKEKIQQYVRAGGSVLILPVEDAENIDVDERVLKAANQGQDLFTIQEIAREISVMAGVSKGVKVLRESLQPDGANASAIASELIKELHSVWADDSRRMLFVGGMLGDGYLSDRRDLCVPRLRAIGPTTNAVWRNHGCAFEEGVGWASALNRRHTTPERFVLLDRTEDPFVSGVFRTCAGGEIARSRPHGLGRTAAIGASLFARDMLSQDISYSPQHETVRPGEKYMVRGQCYQQSEGRGVGSATYVHPMLRADQSLPLKRHGGLTLLRRFVDFAKFDRPSGVLGVVSVAVDSESGYLTVRATGDEGNDWVWNPASRTKTERDVTNERFTTFDHRTGVAVFEVVSESKYEGMLELSLYKPRLNGGERNESVAALLPVVFRGSVPAPPAAAHRAPFYETETLAFDGQALGIIGMLVASLVVFSPLARRWRLADDILVRMVVRDPREPSGQTAHGAPMFSLEASLTEWGTHPGRPAASGSFGLPAGVRGWRSGDSGGSIRIGTLFPMVFPIEGIPPMIPEVKLRTISEAADVMVLIEGSGALASPGSRRAPSKNDFAARLGAFIAHAVRLSHGSVELRRVGREVLEYTGPGDTETRIRAELNEPPTYAPPHSELAIAGPNGRLVFYLCDGLSINSSHLIRLAEELAAEGGQLRVAAIVSQDDADAVGLRRDPVDGKFDDDSETPPAQLLSRRNARLEALSAVIGRRHASLVTFDTALDTQSFLEQVNEAELLA